MKEKKTIGKVIGAVIVLEHLFSSTSFLFLSSRLNDHSAEYVCVCARVYNWLCVCTGAAEPTEEPNAQTNSFGPGWDRRSPPSIRRRRFLLRGEKKAKYLYRKKNENMKKKKKKRKSRSSSSRKKSREEKGKRKMGIWPRRWYNHHRLQTPFFLSLSLVFIFLPILSLSLSLTFLPSLVLPLVLSNIKVCCGPLHPDGRGGSLSTGFIDLHSNDLILVRYWFFFSFPKRGERSIVDYINAECTCIDISTTHKFDQRRKTNQSPGKKKKKGSRRTDRSSVMWTCVAWSSNLLRPNWTNRW